MKTKILTLFMAVMLLAPAANAQFLKNLGNAVKGAAQSSSSNSNSSNSSSNNSSSSNSSSSNTKKTSNVVYYVSAEGSNRANGLSADAPMKDIQKALNAIKEKGENGATVRVAEGNYLGYLDAGYIEIFNWITLEGGWNSTFTQRDPLKYITKMEPSEAQLGTNGSKALINFVGLDGQSRDVLGTVTVDGFMLNLGYETQYKPYDPKDERTGSPEGVETGRMIDDPASQPQHQIIHSDGAVAGNIVICNCLIANSPYFGIQLNTRGGEIEIYNCVIISNRMGGVRISGWENVNQAKTAVERNQYKGYASHVNFHHNTVAFAWCRDKIMEDMGYGYEFMSMVNADLHHNIFFGNNYAAIARTHALSGPDKVVEEKRITNVYNNYFCMNASDIQLPSPGGGKWTNVYVKRFDDIDEKTIPNIDGNKELPANDKFFTFLWEPYLKGYANLKVLDSSSSFDANSAGNQYRQAHGMNMQGTMVHRVSMYGNRYNFAEALKLFGAKEGYGAQKAK